MRNVFVSTLVEIAREDKNVILITGDLGFGVLTEFAKEFPKQYINAGVAEQNMTGLAAGLALEGKTVFTYSICNFPTLRCLEQIRVDAAYHKANVKVVAIGGGYCYGALGVSHHATEDLAILRALPNVSVFAPGDPAETAAATYAVDDTPGPCYLRPGRGGEPTVHPDGAKPDVTKAVPMIPGRDIVLLSTGGMLKNAFEAVNQLKATGLDVGLYSIPSIKPLDREFLKTLAAASKLIVTVEEHSVIGGLGGAVAEVLSEQGGNRARLKMIGVNDVYPSVVGDQDYLRNLHGLSIDGIAATVSSTWAAL